MGERKREERGRGWERGGRVREREGEGKRVGDREGKGGGGRRKRERERGGKEGNHIRIS